MIALTHVPSPNLDRGLRTHVAHASVDYDLALRQHAEYCQMLHECGADVVTLDVNRDLPDCTFIEDTAVVLDELAVLASMGTAAREAEPAGIEPELRKYRPVYRIEPPATLEGGDVLRVGRTLLVGMSTRTNPNGVHALEAIVRRHGYRVIPVPVRNCLHLKTACTELPDESLLVNRSWLEAAALGPFEQVPIPADEPWGANTMSINGVVCLSAAHKQTADLIRGRGFKVRTVSLTEFAKIEGGVTCSSIIMECEEPSGKPE